MAKKRTTRPAEAAKAATVNTAPDTSIPPVYSMRPAGAPPDPKPDPARGALTEGMDIVPAFNELILEGKAAQYMLLDRARMGIQHHYPIIRDKERQRPSPALLLTERDGMLGYDPNRDRLPAERKKPDRYGATYHRATRTLKWTATIHRLATNEELANRVRDLGERRGATAQHLLDDTLKWCKTRQQDPNFMPTAEELRRYRVDMYGLPDKTDKELLKHYLNRPLPLWYTRGVSWDVYPATGPDDARYPVGTIHGAFVATDHKATDHEIWTRWFDEFAAEVEVCVERFKAHNELPDELARLIDNLRAFEIGQGEAAPFIADLRATGAGQRIMNMMNDGKASLLRRLEQVRGAAVPTARTESSPSFLSLLGEKNLTTSLSAICELGYRHTPNKGKGAIVACMEAALEYFSVSVPIAKHWPHMLNEQFPGINASPKAAPPLKATQRTKAYKEARTAMLDRLKG